MENLINVLDNGYVEIVESWGSDERIVEAARMSTNKGFLGWGPKEDGKPGDEKLLRYLWEHKHATPFEMGGLILEIQAPLFVFREWHRHRTQSYNELSARYTQMPNIHYIPQPERVKGQSKTNKQATGSEELDPRIVMEWRNMIKAEQDLIYKSYEWALANGIPKELARLNTPVSRYSRMRASANLRNWLGFLSLRMEGSAQWEIRQYAYAVAAFVKDRFPRTWELFVESNPEKV